MTAVVKPIFERPHVCLWSGEWIEGESRIKTYVSDSVLNVMSFLYILTSQRNQTHVDGSPVIQVGLWYRLIFIMARTIPTTWTAHGLSLYRSGRYIDDAV